MQLAVCRFVRVVGNNIRLDTLALNEALKNTAALRTSLSQARSKLENAIGLADSVKFNTAERAFRIFSESYDRANAEYKRNLAEYMSAHDAYTLRVEEAAERVEQLLICEPEQVVSKPVVAVARTVGASTRQTLLEGLPPINVDPNSEPSIHSGLVQKLPDADVICDSYITYSIRDFQAKALYQHKGLQNMQILLGSPVSGKTEKHPRYLDREENLSSYFEPEIIAPVQAIINKVFTGVQVRGQVGSTMGHADYFIITSVDVNGVSYQSAIAVEFKKPYGLAKEPEPRSRVDGAYSGESNFDYQMRMAGLPTADYGRLAIGQQLRAYVRVRDIANEAPASVAGCLNRKYGILTDYNQTWVV
ncbi:hypothetical protein IWW43_001577, partial [Coemansia sp. RSA 1935]